MLDSHLVRDAQGNMCPPMCLTLRHQSLHLMPARRQTLPSMRTQPHLQSRLLHVGQQPPCKLWHAAEMTASHGHGTEPVRTVPV